MFFLRIARKHDLTEKTRYFGMKKEESRLFLHVCGGWKRAKWRLRSSIAIAEKKGKSDFSVSVISIFFFARAMK